MMYAGALVLAYVIGSFPSAYLAGRIFKGVDLRTVGSGNLGATNVYRTVGALAAALVLVVDAAKGWIAVMELPKWLGLSGSQWWTVALGVAAVIGHWKPVFLLWRGGGKGVSTTAGVFVGLAPVATGIAFVVFALVVLITRYVSAASILAAVALPVAVSLKGAATPIMVASIALSAFVVWSHRENIRRIVRGEERRIGRPGAVR